MCCMNLLKSLLLFPALLLLLAVEGGRQYANLAYQAQSKFMVDAMKVVGVDFDVQEFWRTFKDGLNVGQKAAMEFISYGPQN